MFKYERYLKNSSWLLTIEGNPETIFIKLLASRELVNRKLVFIRTTFCDRTQQASISPHRQRWHPNNATSSLANA